MGEVGIEGGDLSTLKTCPGLGSSRILGMLTDLEGDPLVKVVGTPDSAFMMETRTSRLCRRVYAPLIRGGELFDNAPFDEDSKCLFEDGSCGKGPNRGPLSFGRDRFGGIDRGLAGHEVINRC